jgi:DNA-binding GntR family transcriptional regulator
MRSTAARESKPRPDRLADIAHSKLEELIVTLELAPGSLWSEAMLSDRIGIGRTPVREAVQRLAWEQLLTIIRRHGIRISDIDPHEQMLVLELRKEFEPLVAAQPLMNGATCPKSPILSWKRALPSMS